LDLEIFSKRRLFKKPLKLNIMKRAHILLVEDNEGDILITLEALEDIKIKAEISVGRTGQEALDFLFQKAQFANIEKPNLILLDFNVPIYNGLEILKMIKKEIRFKEIPVIMLATSMSPMDVNLAYENHVNCIISKPLDVEEFITNLMKIDEFWLQISILPRLQYTITDK
jgi:CheY-like chemotaxis protein